MSLQCVEVVAQTQQLEKIIKKVCHCVPELEITTDLPTGIQIHKLESGFYEAKEEEMRIELDLNLQITELRLKVKPSTPFEVGEQWHYVIQYGLEVIACTTEECTGLLDQSLVMVNSLKEDPCYSG